MKTVIVSSIKGGTGKSIISINLALLLKESGLKVGFIDADIESSYFAEYTKAKNQISADQNKLYPADWKGIKVFSMSLLVGKDRAVSMYGFSERELLNDVKKRVDWGDIDVLVIDMPSGAGDVFKETIELWADTLVGGIVVMIPFAELAARRLIKLYQLNEVPILGIIENMAFYKCPKCEYVTYPFGEPIGEKLAKEYGVKYYGMIPLDPRIPKRIVEGNPMLPEDIIEPLVKAINDIVEAKPGTFFEKFKKRMKGYVRDQVAKLVATLIIYANKTFNIKQIQEQYGFKKQYPILLAITDDKGKLLTAIVVRVKEGKLLVVKKKVEPKWVIEIPVRTLASIILGYKIVDGNKIPFDVFDAWATGELKIYGEGATPMLKYIANTLLSNEEINKIVREKFSKLLEYLVR